MVEVDVDVRRGDACDRELSSSGRALRKREVQLYPNTCDLISTTFVYNAYDKIYVPSNSSID